MAPGRRNAAGRGFPVYPAGVSSPPDPSRAPGRTRPAFPWGGRETRGLEFPEAEWPPAPVHRVAYAADIARGRERMAGARVAIGGLARDVERELPRNLERLERIGRCFAEHRVVVFENDSVDATPKLLAEAARRDPRLTVRSETLGTRRWGAVRDLERAAQMAGCRNRLQALLLDVAGDFDHVIVADLDLEGWSLDGLANAFGHDDWDGMTSQGVRFRRNRPFFYDGWAFRTLDDAPWHPHSLRAMVFPRGTPPVRVRSAFSGLAAYRMEAFAAGRYGGEDCEHVVFHDSLARAGFDRLYLNPSMIALYPDFEERA